MLDRASEKLAEVRQERRSNMQSLRKGMNDWARQLASQGVSEEALVVIRRDRLCVPVKAGRQVTDQSKVKDLTGLGCATRLCCCCILHGCVCLPRQLYTHKCQRWVLCMQSQLEP